MKLLNRKNPICPVIHLSQAVLRPLNSADTQDIFELRSNPLIFQYTDIKPYESIKRAQKFIRSVVKDVNKREVYFWGVELNGKIVGTICLWNFDYFYEKGELGYELSPFYQRKGIMSEAIKAILTFADSELKLKSVEAITHYNNQPSLAILKKYGFIHQGIAREVDPSLDESDEMMLYLKKF